jgi:HSP20 family molecular chaperone IbpA
MTTNNRSIPVAVSRQAPEAARRAAQPGNGHRAEPARVYHTPLIDIHEGPEGLTLEADLPGVAEGGVTVQLEDNVLSLVARVNAPAPEGARPLHEEFRVADYFRSFILSDEVDRDRITAELHSGVLRLVLPKAERAKTRRIEIKS